MILPSWVSWNGSRSSKTRLWERRPKMHRTRYNLIKGCSQKPRIELQIRTHAFARSHLSVVLQDQEALRLALGNQCFDSRVVGSQRRHWQQGDDRRIKVVLVWASC